MSSHTKIVKLKSVPLYIIMATKTTIITIFIITSRLLSFVKSFINPPQNGQNDAAWTPFSMDNLGITFYRVRA